MQHKARSQYFLALFGPDVIFTLCNLLGPQTLYASN